MGRFTILPKPEGRLAATMHDSRAKISAEWRLEEYWTTIKCSPPNGNPKQAAKSSGCVTTNRTSLITNLPAVPPPPPVLPAVGLPPSLSFVSSAVVSV